MLKNILFTLVLALPTFAQSQSRQITTQGTARVLASPTIAVVQLGALTQGKTAKAAMEANALIMTGVLKGIAEAGIPDKDVVTTQVSLRPLIEYVKNLPKVIGYEAQNMVHLRITALEKMGDVLDKSLLAGANTISEISLLAPENKEKQDEARKQAVLNSRKNAELLVQAAGSKVGKVFMIQELTPAVPQLRAQVMRADSAAKYAAPPIATGEQSQEVSVNVTWEIVD